MQLRLEGLIVTSLFVAITFPLDAAVGHRLVVSSRVDDTVSMHSLSGKVTVEARELSVESAKENGRTDRSRVLIFFDPLFEIPELHRPTSLLALDDASFQQVSS